MIGKNLAQFRILDKLGEGGMGIVYRAEDEKLGRQVAVKVLHSEFVADDERRKRFIREARTAAALSHPNIAAVHQIDEQDGVIFIAMELVEGETLKSLVDGRPLRADEALRLAIEMTEGLSRAHQANIVHRDLKPENVVVGPDGRLKILDFGLAKLYDDSGSPFSGDSSRVETVSAAVTREGRILGTVAYMSPEQARGVSIDARSDVFTLGVVLYEMVTGKSPFQGDTITDTLTAILRDTQPPVAQFNPQVPAEFERIVARCLQKDPAERYANAGEVLADLRTLKRVSDSRPVPLVTDSGIGAAPARPPRRRPWIWAAGLLLALGAVAVTPWLTRQLGRSMPEAGLGDALAVLPFANLQNAEDPQRLGQILQELIITDLSDLASLRVLSSQRLFDVQRQIVRGPRATIDRETASEVALRAGASTMLTGTLSQLGANWIITLQLVDVEDGTVLKSERLNGEDLYAMVDRLTDLVVRDLGVFGSGAGEDVAVRDRTSSSIEAYQAYLAGVELLNGLDFAAAAERLQRAVEIDPSFGRAYYKLAIARWWAQSVEKGHGSKVDRDPGAVLRSLLDGEVKLSRKDRLMAGAFLDLVEARPAEARPRFEEIVEEYPDEKEGWYGLGEAIFHGAVAKTDRLGALDPFEKAIELDPSFSLAYYHVADLYIAEGRFDEGIERVRFFIEQDPDNLSWYQEWVRLAVARGDETEIDRLIDDSLARIDAPAPRRTFLQTAAMAARNEGKLSLAENLLVRALEQETDESAHRVYGELGELALGRGDTSEAEQWFRRALDLEPRDEQALRGVFRTLVGDRRYREAVTWARERAAADSGFAPHLEMWVAAAIGLGSEQEITAAENAIAERIEDETTSESVATRLAEARIRAYQGVSDAARGFAASEEALEWASGENRVRFLIWSGWLALALGDPEEASDRFDEALEARPGVADALYGGAMADLLSGEPDSAVERAERLLSVAGSTNGWAQARRIEMLLRAGRPEEAEAARREAEAALPGGPESRLFHRELGLAYLGADRPAEALESLRRASAAKSEVVDIGLRSRTVQALAALGRFDEARSEIESGLALWPGNAELLLDLVVTELADGDAVAAERLAREMLSTGPNRAETHALRALALSESGRFDEAETEARRTVRAMPNREGRTILAWVLVDGDRNVEEGLELALEALEMPESFYSAAIRLPFLPPTEHAAGLAFAKLGQTEEAVEMLRRAIEARPGRVSIEKDLRALRSGG